MGRSPFFNTDDVELPAEKPACASILETLQPGQRVTLNINRAVPGRVNRTPSTYGYNTSNCHAVELIVDDINYDASLNKHGIRAIALRDPRIGRDMHMYTWVVTTDGYVRECEHFGIMHELETVELL
jgi:hypothetical protein